MGLLIPVEAGADDLNTFEPTEFERGEENYFVLSNVDDRDEKIRILFPFNFEKVASPYTVTVNLFRNHRIAQSEVIELRLPPKENSQAEFGGNVREGKAKSFRIGYIFMLNALLESENSPFDNHSFPFAFYTFEKLVYGEAGCLARIASEKKDVYSLSEFYDSDLSCVVVCDQNIAHIPDFDFDHYLFDLLLHGFTFVGDQNQKMRTNGSPFLATQFEAIRSRSPIGKLALTVDKAPFAHREISYPITLIKSLIAEETHFLTRFHTLYQIFEMLIDDILKAEIRLQICEITEDLPGHKLKDRVSKLATDGYRVNLLITRYSDISEGLSVPLTEKLRQMAIHINPLYQESGEGLTDGEQKVADTSVISTQSTQLAGLIVKLRNDLVHNYRALYTDVAQRVAKEALANEIVDDLELVCCEILITFGRKPDREKASLIEGVEFLPAQPVKAPSVVIEDS